MKLRILGIYILGYITGVFCLKSFELQNYCKEAGSYDLSMITEDVYGGILEFTFEASMPKDFTCTVIIGSHGFDSNDRMFFYFTKFDLGDNCGPEETWLSVVDGDLTTEPDPIPGLPTRLCGRSSQYMSTTFTTSWRYLQVEYHASNPAVGSGFSIVFKHFSDPPCNSQFEYRCDNNRCIYDKLKCNGEDPCGDGSDCKAGLTVGAILGIIVGVCFGIGLLVIFYQLVPKCLKSQSDDDEVQPEFSRPYPAASQHEMQDLTNVNAAEPPSYASVKDYTNDNSDINNFASDATYHNNDVMRSNRAAGAQRSMEISAPVETESNNDQNEPNNRPRHRHMIWLFYIEIFIKFLSLNQQMFNGH